MNLFLFIFVTLAICTPLLVLRLFSAMRTEAYYRDLLHDARNRLVRDLRTAEHFRTACEHSSDGILLQDMSARVVWCNEAYCKIMGRPKEEIIGRNPLEFALPPEDTPPQQDIDAFHYDVCDQTFRDLHLAENQRPDGTRFWNQISVSFKNTGDGNDRAILICRDVTEQINQENHLKETRNKLQIQATRDSLTGLANRAVFLKQLKKSLAKPQGRGTALLHVDLDRFKEINDTHGHSAGDFVLQHVARTLEENTRTEDIVARTGGDEFFVICHDVNRAGDVIAIGNKINRALAQPFEFDNIQLTCSASIGAAIDSKTSPKVDDLMLQADFALYEAKRAGRDRVAIYDRALHERRATQQRRVEELYDAVDMDALNYAFQPTIELDSRRIVGVEALVRWHHPVDGIIAPVDFLPIAEEAGLMGDLDLGSMSAALRMKKALNDNGFTHVGMSFNASPALMAHPEFINRLIWGVESGGIDRGQITVEVLETTAFGDPNEMSSYAAVIRDLRRAGFQVHLDDFGVGYAGLAHLAQLDVTGVKIDRALVRDILSDPTRNKIVRKIIELCNDMELDVIAEGVEDIRTAITLRSMGCSVVQGFWLSKPIPDDALFDWLSAHSVALPSLPA